ncbi:MAG: P-loop NTPase, partial [Bacteroidales bacterium]|nr:P-loop NTPase [Bacteroidales bacterium]
IPLTGAIIVTTPQAVALADVEKSVNMFRNPQIEKPILGVIENMSWFTPAELPENRYYLFGRDGGQLIADKYGIPLLGQIPLVQSVREGGDEGVPAALEDGPVFDAMKDAAQMILSSEHNL